LAWRFLVVQKDSALARRCCTRTEGPSGARKATMFVALARKLRIAPRRLVMTGEAADGVALRPARCATPLDLGFKRIQASRSKWQRPSARGALAAAARDSDGNLRSV
jgi:hypothetical protein